MKITADTNVLIRALTLDDPVQGPAAIAELTRAEQVILPDAVLCELVWVLEKGYAKPRDQIIAAIDRLAATANIHLNQTAVSAGLSFLANGGDFADGIIASSGAGAGAGEFVSFDKKAVALAAKSGIVARMPG